MIIRQQQQQLEELSRTVDELQEQQAEVAEPVPPGDTQVVVDWEEGPMPTFELYKTNDAGERERLFNFKLRGRLYVDGGGLGDDDFYKNDNGTELRAARIGVEGRVLEGWRYRLEVDFADSSVDVKDAYSQYSGEFVEPAFVRVGQHKTPNSLEELTSSRFITFMERAAITDGFALERQIGLAGGVSGDNWGVGAGLFGQNASDVNDNEGYAIAGRGHYAVFPGAQEPAEDSTDVIHLGASARYRNFDNDTFDSEGQHRQRPFFHFTGTRSVDTGTIDDAEGDAWVGGEFAWVRGPFSLQSEVANTFLQRKNGQDDANNLWGGYLSASYFLTGEHRNYDPEGGAFERVKVTNPVHEGGLGAWEVAARADYIDLNNEGVKGGEQVSYIAGINWYAKDWIRLMLDGAITQVFSARNSDAAVDGSSNLIYGAGVRAQVDW